MTDPIDYSRPVGWWCPVCTRVSMGDYLLQAIRLNRRCLDTDEARQRRLHMVPVYLPIPEGQRPLIDDEVGEAEVVTWCNERGIPLWGPFHVDPRFPDARVCAVEPDIAWIVTGATE